ncbi:MAG TPA: transporter, partial [Candidatus Marinimicrobia bacterium]|nr:transporter [Candidatus Neomarinimicrobiota bacterium]
ASTDVDAVYYNPAGLTKLFENGLFLDVSNQTIWQTKTVTNDTPTLNNHEFVGKVFAPVFPSAYIAYKMDKLVLSGGFMPIGGGGSAKFEKGLPSFEVPVSALKTALASAGVTDYKLDINFEGSSIYYGVQGGVSYKINEIFSVFGGARYVMASNSYTGYLKNIKINPAGGEFIPATNYFTQLSNLASGGASSVQPIINAGGGNNTLAELVSANIISAADSASIARGLVQFGVPASQISAMNANQIHTTYSTIANTMAEHAFETADKEVDAAQSGSGVAGIFGINISPNENLNIGIRYETITKMELENDTKKDDTGLFPDSAKYGADIPSQLAVGVSYNMGKIKLMMDFNYYNNGAVDWDGDEKNFDNTTEFGLGAEYALTEKLKVSLGGQYSMMGAKPESQSDMDFNLDAFTIGGGVEYQISPKVKLNVGALDAFYIEAENASGIEKYNQTNYLVAFGVQVKL